MGVLRRTFHHLCKCLSRRDLPDMGWGSFVYPFDLFLQSLFLHPEMMIVWVMMNLKCFDGWSDDLRRSTNIQNLLWRKESNFFAALTQTATCFGLGPEKLCFCSFGAPARYWQLLSGLSKTSKGDWTFVLRLKGKLIQKFELSHTTSSDACPLSKVKYRFE